jgi:hypothetical protein
VPTLIGAFIAEQRRLAGLSRSQLASRIGYTNLNKGSRRIVELEQWGEAKSDLLPRIVAALNLDADQVRALVDEDRHPLQRARSWHTSARGSRRPCGVGFDPPAGGSVAEPPAPR